MVVQEVTIRPPIALDDARIEAFRASLRGELLGPDDTGYDAARMVHNGMIDQRPALIARCAGPADVMRAVDFAREYQLVVSVRGGGHNVTGNAVCDGGLTIDLLSDEASAGRPRRANRPLRGGPHLGGVRPRDASLRPRDDWRAVGTDRESPG